jgi:hypothetical protein
MLAITANEVHRNFNPVKDEQSWLDRCEALERGQVRLVDGKKPTARLRSAA